MPFLTLTCELLRLNLFQDKIFVKLKEKLFNRTHPPKAIVAFQPFLYMMTAFKSPENKTLEAGLCGKVF